MGRSTVARAVGRVTPEMGTRAYHPYGAKSLYKRVLNFSHDT